MNTNLKVWLGSSLLACGLSASGGVNAAVMTQLFSLAEMTNPVRLNDFESIKDTANVTFDATAFLVGQSAASNVTPSIVKGLAEPAGNQPLGAMLTQAAFEVGMWFGNDENLIFDVTLEVFDGVSSLGSVILESNGNDFADQFIALRSDMAFDRAEISYERPAAENLSIYIDDFYVGEGDFEPPPNGVPEPITPVLLGLGLAGVGFARRRLH